MTRQRISYKNKNYAFILSVIDVFSGYTWLRPLRDKRSISVKYNVASIFKQYGFPQIVQHDCGKEFEGHCGLNLKDNNIKQLRSRPYYPQSQGKVEWMRLILQKLEIVFMKHHAPNNLLVHHPVHQVIYTPSSFS